MTFERIRHRLQSGRPLVVDSDTAASFRARGVELASPGALGALLRGRSSEVSAESALRGAWAASVLSGVEIGLESMRAGEIAG